MPPSPPPPVFVDGFPRSAPVTTNCFLLFLPPTHFFSCLLACLFELVVFLLLLPFVPSFPPSLLNVVSPSARARLSVCLSVLLRSFSPPACHDTRTCQNKRFLRGTDRGVHRRARNACSHGGVAGRSNHRAHGWPSSHRHGGPSSRPHGRSHRRR